jgi:hypothetical protein
VTAPGRETMPRVAWGRQIAVAMTPGDEQVFLAFLREQCDLAILRTPAPSRDATRLEDFTPRRPHGTDAFYL